jgi:phosphonate transport system substrate-binding protein
MITLFPLRAALRGHRLTSACITIGTIIVIPALLTEIQIESKVIYHNVVEVGFSIYRKAAMEEGSIAAVVAFRLQGGPMGLRRLFPGRILIQAAWQIGLAVGLAGAAMFAVQIIGVMTEAPEPLVDVFQPRPLTEPQTDPSNEHRNKLRFAVATMVSAEETFSTYRQFVKRISRDIGREEVFILRPSYEDVRLALMHGEVDAAFVCTGTYLSGLESKSIKLLVQPEFGETKRYRSLLLVPSDSGSRTWEDLRHKVMAFTDSESFTGCLLPSEELAERGQTPDDFFKKVIYTGSHDRSIMAVAANVVDAAAVDSLVWVSTLDKKPSIGKQVRIIWQSRSFSPPPIVVPAGLDSNLEEALRKALLSLHKDEEGRRILAAIGIRRFVPPQPESYATAVELYRQYQNTLGKP